MFEQAFKNIDDVLWKEAGCTTELDYTEQTSWLLFLKYLDGLEQDRADEAALDGKKVRLHPRKAVPLGNLGRAEGQDRQARPQHGHDRRRSASTSSTASCSRTCTASSRRPAGRTRSSTRSARSSARSKTRSPAATTSARSSTTSTNCDSARRRKSTSCPTCTKPRSRAWATPAATAASTTRPGR